MDIVENEAVVETVEEIAEPVVEAEAAAPEAEAAPAAEGENKAPAEKKPAPRQQKRRRKVCIFCADKIEHIDYKDIGRLRKCISERSKILPRRASGTCTMHQRQLTVAVKRARHMALLPFLSD
ncbi:MAG: 30S ribosomal protein S18 [Clostridia bacterium]|nr:30S ribosomal protein S18 [Clostridia bacterium]